MKAFSADRGAITSPSPGDAERTGRRWRDPHSCPHRASQREVTVRGTLTSTAVCQLASHFVQDLTNTACRVDEAVCRACCQHPLSIEAGPNPVVASIMVSSLQRIRNSPSLSVVQQVDRHQREQYAMRWLERVDGPRRPPPVRPVAGPTASLTRGRPARPPRIGLVGTQTHSGLGYQNRDLALHFPIDRWLILGAPPAQGVLAADGGRVRARIDVLSRPLSALEIDAWLDGLDAILFVERPACPGLTSQARSAGVRVICIPNWEWLHPGLPWLDDVDLMLCPTTLAAQMLLRWKSLYHFTWRVESVDWPIDTDRFGYRRRSVCRRFLYVNGSGGAAAGAVDGSAEGGFRRKGLDVVLAAARLVPNLPIVIFASRADISQLPPNVSLRHPPRDNRWLYGEADVCIQPSRWEGLGLPLLECQAAGMPLITTDLPPMNQHRPWRRIPARSEAVYLSPEICIPAARICPEDLARTMHGAQGRTLLAASWGARRFVQRRHSWRRQGASLAALVHRFLEARDS